MICDNCGAIIDDNEDFCPNCGMQLLDMRPQQKKKKTQKKKKKSRSPGFEDTRPADKPIKQRYIENSEPESYGYSQYFDDDEYEEAPQQDYYPEEQKKKSGIRMGDIILFILIALILGFITGLFMFSSQLIPQIPGINS